MADSPGGSPAAFQASIILAPLALLAAGALVTQVAAESAARNSAGGWINLSSLSYAIAWVVYLACATGFVWMDWYFVRRLPDRTWPSQGRMLAATAGAAAAGIGVAVVGAGTVGGGLVFLGSQRAPGSQVVFYLFLAAIPLAGVVGLIADLRIRRGARIRSV